MFNEVPTEVENAIIAKVLAGFVPSQQFALLVDYRRMVGQLGIHE